MKKVFLFLLLVFVTAACDRVDNTLTLHDESSVNELTKSSVSDELFSFDKVKEQWSSYNSLSKMFAATMIPEGLAEKISTETLIKIALSHPLIANYAAYNNEIKGLKVLYENFNGLQILCEREDTEELLLKLLPDTSLSMFEAGFIELLLGSELVKYRNPSLKEMYDKVINDRIKFLESHPEDYSFITIRRTLHLQAYIGAVMEGLNPNAEEVFEKITYTGYDVVTKASGDITGYCTVYTEYGQAVQEILLQEMTSSEIAYYDQEARTEYPNATYISPSSFQYNCHSYAWNMSEGGPRCLINATSGNLSKYWTYDAFTLTTASNAERIYYPNGDHSALPIPYNSSKYISKWGALPVMEHLPSYCPYVSTNLRYYSDDITPNHFYQIVGEDLAALNYPYIYTLPNVWNNLTVNWEIDDNHGMDTDNTVMPDGKSITVTFTRPSEYTIICRIYKGSQLLSVGLFGAVFINYGELSDLTPKIKVPYW